MSSPDSCCGAYTAKARVVARAGPITITREECGSGQGRALTPEAAETDATKRALATFGNPLGLALYDRDLAGMRNRRALDLTTSSPEAPVTWTLRIENGTEGASFKNPAEFAQALKTAMSGVANIERMFALWEQNLETFRALNRHLNREGQAGDLA